jgi:hypothetical protein
MDHIFYLRVENDVCSAKVTAIDHPYHQLYHVLFDDGYENIFFTDVETGNWIEEDLGETALAANFGTKVYLLEGRTSISGKNKPLAWCKASAADKIVCFGFYTYVEGTDTFFEVYGNNHRFLYLFRYTGNAWEVAGMDNIIIEPQLYTDLIKIIISIFKGLAGYI